MKLDVRTKFLLLFFANYLLLNRVQGLYEWGVIAFLVGLFIASSRQKAGLIYLGIFLTMYAIETFGMDYLTGKWLSFLSVLVIGGRIMLPTFMAGAYLMSTTSISELMHGLRKWRVPEAVLLTFAVMMRFLPTIKESYRTIRQSLKLRGVFVSGWDILKRPVIFFEYVLVPLLMSASRTAQDLAIASLTKAVGAQQERTEFKRSTFGKQDVALMVLMVSVILWIEGSRWR